MRLVYCLADSMHRDEQAVLRLAGEVPYPTVRAIILPNLLVQLNAGPLTRLELSGTSIPYGTVLWGQSSNG